MMAPAPSNGRQDHLGRCVLHRAARAREVAALDMADLVGEHADDLARLLGRGQHAGGEEEIGSAGDEGVDAGIVDDMQPHRAVVEARCLQQWRGIGADGSLDLGVADERHALRSRRRSLPRGPRRELRRRAPLRVQDG